MKKKGLMLAFLLCLASTLTLVSAEKLDVIPIKDTFSSGENIVLRTSLLDSNNSPINSDVEIIAEDALKKDSIKKTIPANTLVELSLGESAPSGYWKITATYYSPDKEPLAASAIFMVEVSEIAKFELKDSILTIINTGNTRYTKIVQIVIGESIGSKQLDLGVGESTSFRLIAPEGAYTIKVTDGKTTITQSGVMLTGNVIGILDNEERVKSPLTTAVGGEIPAYGEDKPINLFKNNILVYAFLIVLFCAAILLAVERRVKAKALSN